MPSSSRSPTNHRASSGGWIGSTTTVSPYSLAAVSQKATHSHAPRWGRAKMVPVPASQAGLHVLHADGADLGVELGRGHAGQAERLQPVVGVGGEGGVDGAAQGRPLELGAVDAAQVALGDQPPGGEPPGADPPGQPGDGRQRPLRAGPGRRPTRRGSRGRSGQGGATPAVSRRRAGGATRCGPGWRSAPGRWPDPWVRRAEARLRRRAWTRAARGVSGTVELAWFQTLTKRWPAVNTVGASMTQRMAIMAGWNSRARPMRIEALGPLHEAALGVVAQGLGLGPLVGDDQRGGQHGQGQHGDAPGLGGGEVPGHAAEEEGVGHPVHDRVEERAAGRGGAGGLGHGAVEHVGDGAEHQEQEAQAEGAVGDGEGGGAGHDHAEDGEVVGGDAGLADGLTDGAELLLGLGPELTVEHRLLQWVRLQKLAGSTVPGKHAPPPPDIHPVADRGVPVAAPTPPPSPLEAPWPRSPRPASATWPSWATPGPGKTTLAEALLHLSRGHQPAGPGRGRHHRQRPRPGREGPGPLGRPLGAALRVEGPPHHPPRHPRRPRLRRRRGGRPAGRRPGRVRGQRGRRGAGGHRGRLAGGRGRPGCPAWSSSAGSTATGPRSTPPWPTCGPASGPASPPSSCPSGPRPTSAAWPTC